MGIKDIFLAVALTVYAIIASCTMVEAHKWQYHHPGSSIIAETQMRYDTTQARLFTKDHKKDCNDDITDTQVMEHVIWQNDQILERMK